MELVALVQPVAFASPPPTTLPTKSTVLSPGKHHLPRLPLLSDYYYYCKDTTWLPAGLLPHCSPGAVH